MATVPLSTLDWQLIGWRPFAWRLGKKLEGPSTIVADIGPIPARIPASVQQLLLEANIIEDWNVGINSLKCEWVEHRHWDFSATISADCIAALDNPIILEAPGLDYSGWILIDCNEVARFEGTLLPHRFDLTPYLSDGQSHLLSIIFDEPPPEQGQCGYTSLSKYFKPRYTYSWDWCPRIVPIGVWLPVTLQSGPDAWMTLEKVQTQLATNNQSGNVVVAIRCGRPTEIHDIKLQIWDGDRLLTEKTSDTLPNETIEIRLDIVSARPWFPNGYGEHPCYELRITATNKDLCPIWTYSRQIGFKRVEWRSCKDAPTGADPWLCVINDVPIFLQGANWVPPKALYHDAYEDDYACLIHLYQEMGVNVLRVWGGGILEKPAFYEYCDRAGILVWQELPLSSSGVENCPPDDPESIALLTRISQAYISQRAHHVSLLLWSGGNELTWGGPNEKFGVIPVNDIHPCIWALKEFFEKADPDHRFIATSPTGPRFYAHASDYGKGLHHDVHGPWGLSAFSGATFEEKLNDWKTYWDEDDALFRSEVGMPGAASIDCIAQFSDPKYAWPPEGIYWLHTAAWWTQWDLCKSRLEPITDSKTALAAYIQLTQQFQAEAYEKAAKSCKKRFPACGGFTIWMGHDCFPCPANNSVIDFLRIPKPAYYALKRVFITPCSEL